MKNETNSTYIPHSNSLRANSPIVGHVSFYMKCTMLDLHVQYSHGHIVALLQYQLDL